MARKPRLYPTEHEEQVAIINWVDTMAAAGQYPGIGLLMAIPNGGLRIKAVARKMVAEGARAGVPDLFLPVARGGYHGLWIELKAHGGRLQPNQIDWLNKLEAQGYCTTVAFGFEQAKRALIDYLALEDQNE